jgi:hypothetical protein
MRYTILFFFGLVSALCQAQTEDISLELNEAQAARLIQLPLHCLDTEYPNKLGQVLGDASDLLPPAQLHPAFYGCFDWHSAVHGHWSLARLINLFPDMAESKVALEALQRHLTPEHIRIEIEAFDEHNKNFERTYGWAWLMKLQMELSASRQPELAVLGDHLQGLTDSIVKKMKAYLPKLNYPIRVGTHTNTAFGLALMYDYASWSDDEDLAELIEERARDFYFADENCPMSWEPSGSDFLSPCFEEARLMAKVLEPEEYHEWLKDFLPGLEKETYTLEPGIVTDRKDGQLVHLDGLNFSRAWCFYEIMESLPEYAHLRALAERHMRHSLPEVVGDSYEGGHWLASFALLALSKGN